MSILDWIAFAAPILIVTAVALFLFAVQARWRRDDRELLLQIAGALGLESEGVAPSTRFADHLRNEPNSDQEPIYRRGQLRPWFRWFAASLFVAFMAYAIYYLLVVFPSYEIVTEPWLTYLFFGLVAANGFWLVVLVGGESYEDELERRFILDELRRLRKKTPGTKPRDDRE